jgi:uncharacterized RDD family membrane protein YckC
MSTINIQTFLNIDLSFSLSGVGTRFGAFFIDWAIKIGYVLLVSNLFAIDVFSSNYILSFIIYIPFIFYSFLFEWLLKGQTIGKKILHIKVIGVDGNEVSISQCAIRWIFLFADAYVFSLASFIYPAFAGLSLFGPAVGAVLIGVSKKQQRLGDMAAKTYVVSTKESYFSIEDTIYSYSNKHKSYVVKYPEVIKLKDKDMTIIKELLEKAEYYIDDELAFKLASQVKKVLDIQSDQDDISFLKVLLSDYNHLTIT